MRSCFLALGLILVATLLSGCATRIYGVPEAHWERMGPTERSEAISAWSAVQLAREERRREEALLARQREAHQSAQRELCEQLAAENRPTKPRVPPRRDGVSSAPPGLVQVSLLSGQIYVANRHRRFEPVSFSLEEGQTSRIVLLAPPNHRAQLSVSLEHGLLSLDLGPGSKRDGATSLAWRDWRDGTSLTINTAGPLRLRDVELNVEAVTRPVKRDNVAHDRAQARR
jgi:hypothetical protein